MMPSERYARALAWMATELRRQNPKTGSQWSFEFHDDEDASIPADARSVAGQKALLVELEKRGAVRSLKITTKPERVRVNHPSRAGASFYLPLPKPVSAELSVSKAKFDKVCKEFVSPIEAGSKPHITISRRNGVSGNGKSYEISGKRAQTLFHIAEKRGARLAELRKLTGQQNSEISNEIRRINKVFREKLGVEADLIVHSGTSGYTLNGENLLMRLELE